MMDVIVDVEEGIVLPMGRRERKSGLNDALAKAVKRLQSFRVGCFYSIENPTVGLSE